MAAVWLSGAPTAPPVASFALECLAWAHALPQLTTQLSPHVWWQLAEQLVAIASRPSDQAGPLSAQLLWAELPLTLAYNFPEIDACQALAEPGLDTLATGFAELLDGEGLIHAQHLHLQWPLIACWTRSQSVAKRLPEGGWPKPLQTEFALLLRNAARLTRPDGRPALATTGPGRAKPALLAAATRLATACRRSGSPPIIDRASILRTDQWHAAHGMLLASTISGLESFPNPNAQGL